MDSHIVNLNKLFCNECGNLVSVSLDDDATACDVCGHAVPSAVYESRVTTTRSGPNAFPSPLRQRLESLVQKRDVEKKKVYVDEECEKCGNPQMSVRTLQMRSADEGATVFYTCERCGHQMRLNN